MKTTTIFFRSSRIINSKTNNSHFVKQKTLFSPTFSSTNSHFYSTHQHDGSSDENHCVSQSRTKIVAELWKKRLQIEQASKTAWETSSSSSPPSTVHSLLTKSPKDSYESIEFNFTTDKKLLLEYQSFIKGEVRYGRILEDMDAFAGNLAHTHADDSNPHSQSLHIVTACVDKIDIVEKFPLNVDVVMEGNTVWVGTSSMLVKVRMIELVSKKEILEATFLMAARDSTGKGTAVNKVQPTTPEEIAEFEEGAALIQRRKSDKNNSLDLKPPTYPEFTLIHSQFFPSSSQTDNNNNNIKNNSPLGKQREQVLMSSTKLQSVVLCHPQEKNTRDRIFGGYLMRKAYELGESNAHLFCGGKAKPFLIAIGEITFLRPVEIGSIIRFDSFVTYSTSFVFFNLLIKILIFLLISL